MKFQIKQPGQVDSTSQSRVTFLWTPVPYTEALATGISAKCYW
jgi:hypothetical protein